MRRCLLALVGLMLGVTPVAAASCVVPGVRLPLDRIWQPDTRAAVAFAHARTGDIAFAVRTAHRFYGYQPDHVELSASVVKAMLMVAYLDRPSVAGRPLNGYDRSLLVPMITQSDNNAASTVDGIVGNGGLSALAARVGMTRFTPVANPWGATRITARDQTRFLLHVDQFIRPRHRAYAMHLLASITPSQRWGIGQVAPRGWHLYFKGGWGYGTGLLDHQVVLLTRGCARVSLAVLSMYDGSHEYGKATLRGMFARLLRGFPTGAPLYPFVGGARYSGRLRDRGGTVIGTLSFVVSRHGGAVRQLVARVTATCARGAVLDAGSLPVDPHGAFAGPSRGGAMVLVAGRFVARHAVTGTLTLRDPPAQGCDVRARFVARTG